MFFEIWVVWVVMQLTPSVVTNLSSTLSLQKHINRGREVHEIILESLHCYAGGIGALFSHTFSLEAFSLCCRAWRLSSLERRSSRSRSRFRQVPNLKRRYTCTFFKIDKDGISLFFPNHCSMCDLIFVYDHILMLIRLLFHVYLITISLYVVILV